MVISNYLLDAVDSNKKLRIIQAFDELTNAVDRMIAGEYVDTEFEGKEISNEYLEYIHKNKTGALIKASCKIGGILAEAGIEDMESITTYANCIRIRISDKR